MHLTPYLAALSVAMSITPALTQDPPVPSSHDTAPCTDLGPSCDYVLNAMTDVWQCNCTSEKDNKPDLAWFYTGTWFTGYLYEGFGDYDKCQNLPAWWAGDKGSWSNSMQTTTISPTVCCVYTSEDCQISDLDNNCLAWKQVDPAIAQFEGYFDEGVRSFRCAWWSNVNSTCDGGDSGWPQNAPCPGS